MPTSSDEVTLSNDSKRINNEFKETTHALEQSRWMSLPPEKSKLSQSMGVAFVALYPQWFLQRLNPGQADLSRNSLI